jgi:thiol:disulfide interchange protein
LSVRFFKPDCNQASFTDCFLLEAELVKRIIPSGLAAVAFFLAFSLNTCRVCAQESLNEPISVTLVSGSSDFMSGDTVVFALKCRIKDKYHLYGNPLGPGIGKPLTIDVEKSESVNWIEARASAPQKFTPEIGGWVWAYENQATFFITGVYLGQSADAAINGKIILDGLVCHTSCIPFVVEVPVNIKPDGTSNKVLFGNNPDLQQVYRKSVSIPFNTRSAESASSAQSQGLGLSGFDEGVNEASPDYKPIEAGNDKDSASNAGGMGILMAILMAFAAGIILNAMPCVLPVLGIKILSFSQGLAGGKKEAVLRSLVFAAGMVSVFIALATLAAFANFSWGQQFQNPKMLAGIIAFMVIFAMGMFDAYTIIVPSGLANMGGGTSHSMSGEFTRGVFATVLATPCSGPLLGAVLAWALTQPPMVIYAVFISIGAGMASPYILFSSSSRIARIIPKPGRWMDDFKHVMGFLLIGFAVYLMSGLSREMILITVMICLGLVFGAGIYGRIAPFGAPASRKMFAGILALAVCFFVGYSGLKLFSEDESTVWTPFSTEALENAHFEGQPVLANFTAQWCMNCQYNKHNTLSSKDVLDIVKEKNVLLVEVDLTNSNPEGEALLHTLGSRSVPFLAVFSKDDPYKPVILRDIVSKRKLIDELKKL